MKTVRGSESIDAKRHRSIYFIATEGGDTYFGSETSAQRHAKNLIGTWDLYRVDLYGYTDRRYALIKALNGDPNVGIPELLYGSE